MIDKTIKILAIGNSFSVDAMEYLYGLFEYPGYTPILGNLYIGGCTLERHLENSRTGEKAYTYYKNTDGVWTSVKDAGFCDGIIDEDWDIITFQQQSGRSGNANSIAESLDKLISFVDLRKRNKNARYFWHMTWAYQKDSDHPDFENYDFNQMKMYRDILSAVKKEIIPHKAFSGIIPAGTAVQNARTDFFGDTLTRDGFHLTLNEGRFIASLTWYAAITGDTEFNFPKSTVPFEISDNAFEAIKAAVRNSFCF